VARAEGGEEAMGIGRGRAGGQRQDGVSRGRGDTMTGIRRRREGSDAGTGIGRRGSGSWSEGTSGRSSTLRFRAQQLDVKLASGLELARYTNEQNVVLRFYGKLHRAEPPASRASQ